MARVVEGDENSADTYRDFYRYSGCRLKAAGVALLRLDHAGKDISAGGRAGLRADDLDSYALSLVEERVVLTRTKSRVSYVPAEVALVRETDPYLHHVVAPVSYPPGTPDCAALLDKFGVALDATAAVAMGLLKEAGQGKRKAIVLAALKLRRNRARAGNQRGGHRHWETGTGKAEPTMETSSAASATQQVMTLQAVPGTNGNHPQPSVPSPGTGFPLSRGEPVPDLTGECFDLG